MSSQTERPSFPKVVKIRHHRKGAFLGLVEAKLHDGKKGLLLPLVSSEIQDLSQRGVKSEIVNLGPERARRLGVIVNIEHAHHVVNRRLRLADKNK